MKATKSMLAEAKKSGAMVTKIKKIDPKPDATSNGAPATPDNAADLKALRDEISELRGLLDETKVSSDKRIQELSAIITGLSSEKPIRVKPVRDLDPQSKTYLLVKHYDFVPVTYRKLDS